MGSNSHWRISFSQANPVIYNTAFTLLNKAVHSPANPVKFLTDFEKALMQAMHRHQFPNSNNSQELLLPLYPDNPENNSSSWSSIALGDYWVNTASHVSWERLAWVLYQCREERAPAAMKQYLQQGMCSS